MHKTEKTLSIIIVNWNSWHHINNCLNSIKQYADNIKKEIIVVDNNSNDKSCDKIRKYHPEASVISLLENIGFPRANNIGFSLATGRYILVLNPDTIIYENTLQDSISFLENNKDYGCVGVKTLKPNNRIQFACAKQFTTLRGALFATVLLDKIFPGLKFLKSPDMAFWDHENDRDVEMIQGAYMMFPKTIYSRTGGFNEDIPMFFEDNEFCIRLMRNNYKIRYLSHIKITHAIGQSLKKAAPEWVVMLRYESAYLSIKLLQGNFHARMYPFLLLFILPLKLLLLPYLSLGLYIKNRYNNFSILYYETIYGFLWVKKKIKEIKDAKKDKQYP